MLRCNNCGQEFEEPREIKTSYESYYGVASMFGNSTPLYLDVCPYCGDEDVEECD